MTPLPTLARIPPDRVAGRLWDAIVIGAGPAGAVAAHQLARRGRSVLLVERAKFPRAKVCGSCLGAAGLALLTQLGLPGLAEVTESPRVEELRIRYRGLELSVLVPAGRSISRERLDGLLVAAAIAEGASFMDQTRAEVCPSGGPPRAVHLKGAEGSVQARARVIIAADGLGGRSLEQAQEPPRQVGPDGLIGLGARLAATGPADRMANVVMACDRRGYVGLVQLEDGRLNIAGALRPGAIRDAGGPGRLVASVLAEAGVPLPAGLDTCSWSGTPALAVRRTALSAPGLFIVGDACGYMEPFTGEGMSWAMAGATALAPIAARAAGGWSDGYALEWSAAYRGLIARRMRICAAVGRVLRSGAGRQAGAFFLSRCPRLARVLAGWIHRPFGFREVAAGREP